MSTVAYIVEEAFREAGMLAETQYSTPAQTEQAVARLANLVATAYSAEAGEPLADWPVGTVGAEYVHPLTADSQRIWDRPEQNSRLLLNHNEALTIYFAPMPSHGARMQVVDVDGALAAHNVVLDGNGRLIEGARTVTLSTNDLNAAWLYDADAANWTRVSPIVATGSMPFPEEFDDYFITSLAMRLNPRYGRTISEGTGAALARSLERMRARYAQSQDVAVALPLRRLTEKPGDFGYYARPFGWMR